MARPKSMNTKIVGVINSLESEQQEKILSFLEAMIGNAAVSDDEAPAAKSRKNAAPAKSEKVSAKTTKKVVDEDEDEGDETRSHAEIVKSSFDTIEDIQTAMSEAFADDDGNLTEDRNNKRMLSFMKKFDKDFSEKDLDATKPLREIAENIFADVDALLGSVGPRAKAKVLGNNLYACALVYLPLIKADNLDELLEEAGYGEDDIAELSDHDKVHYIIAAANGLTFEASEEDEDGEDEDEGEEEGEEEEAPAPKKRGRPAKDEDEDEDDFEAPKRRRAKA